MKNIKKGEDKDQDLSPHLKSKVNLDIDTEIQETHILLKRLTIKVNQNTDLLNVNLKNRMKEKGIKVKAKVIKEVEK